MLQVTPWTRTTFWNGLFTIMPCLWALFDTEAQSKSKFLREDNVYFFSGKYIQFSVCKHQTGLLRHPFHINISVKLNFC